MRKIFDYVDDALIDGAFQPVVDRIARHLQIDCFHLARVCTNIAAVAWILSQATDVAAAFSSGLAGLQVLQAALLLLGLGSIMVLHALFQRVGGNGKANPLRAGMYMHRFCLLLGLLVNIGRAAAGLGSMALLAVGVFATVAVYLGACSNPPPTRRKANWHDRLAALPR